MLGLKDIVNFCCETFSRNWKFVPCENEIVSFKVEVY